MRPGINKCKWIAPENMNGNLTLSGSSLEKVKSYKYLGLPMTLHGIDFKTYFTNVLKSARTELICLKNMDYYLSNVHRLHLVKSQVLSKIEYSLPLLSKWLDIKEPKESKIKKEIKKDLQNLITECRQWSGNTGNKKILAGYLTNIHDINQIMEEREAGLVEQLQNLEENHPLIQIFNMQQSFPQKYKEESILFQSLLSNIRADHKEYQIKNNCKINLKTYIKKTRREKYIQESKLVAYTIDLRHKEDKDMKTTSTDLVYRIKNHKTRQKALSWRTGNFGYIDFDRNSASNNNRHSTCHYCKNCMVKFNRDHVNHCPLIVNYPGISTAKWRKFKENSKKVQQLNKDATGYTIIDDVLNSFNIHLFEELIQVLENNLEILSQSPCKNKFSNIKAKKITRSSGPRKSGERGERGEEKKREKRTGPGN